MQIWNLQRNRTRPYENTLIIWTMAYVRCTMITPLLNSKMSSDSYQIFANVMLNITGLYTNLLKQLFKPRNVQMNLIKNYLKISEQMKRRNSVKLLNLENTGKMLKSISCVRLCLQNFHKIKSLRHHLSIQVIGVSSKLICGKISSGVFLAALVKTGWDEY